MHTYKNSDHEFCHSHMMAMMMMMMMLDRHTLICSVCSFHLCEGTEFIINVGILPDTSCSTTTRGNDQSVHGTFISVLLFLLPCWNFPLLLPFCHLSLSPSHFSYLTMYQWRLTILSNSNGCRRCSFNCFVYSQSESHISDMSSFIAPRSANNWQSLVLLLLLFTRTLAQLLRCPEKKRKSIDDWDSLCRFDSTMTSWSASKVSCVHCIESQRAKSLKICYQT